MEDNFLYEGKAKKILTTGDPMVVRMVFKDDATAFDGKKKGKIGDKGQVNARISSRIFRYLQQKGIDNHFIEQREPGEIIARRLEIIPVEVVVRNLATGSISRRLGLKEGLPFNPSILEFYFKDDQLGDPMINEDHIQVLGWASREEVEKMRESAHRVNDLLLELFRGIGIQLVDFKLEFGRAGEDLLLGDEISPDTCRLWDLKTGEKLDKDRFRQDLGNTEAAYQEILRRIEELEE